MTPRDPLAAARDVLAFILTGEFNGKGFELNDQQVQRTQTILEQLAAGRMFAMTEVPPVTTDALTQPKLFQHDDPTVN